MSFGTSSMLSKGSQGGTSSPDPGTQGQVVKARGAYDQSAQNGPGPLLTGAGNYGTSLEQGGLLGTSALSGDPNAVSKLMNPYQQQVVDATNAAYNKSGVQAVNSVDSDATRSGAFGGSRNAVAAGVAASNNELNRNQAISGLLYSGYNTAMGQASTLAGQGTTGAGMNSNLGMLGVGDPSLWAANMYKQSVAGMPTGTVNNTNQFGNSFGTTSSMSVGSMAGA